MSCRKEITSVSKIALYINKNVRFQYPDASNENEIDLIAHGQGSFIIDQVNEYPKWARELAYSGNYKVNYVDTFSFLLHGVETNVPSILRNLRNNRVGYIAEIITTGGYSYVFPAPVFLNQNNIKQINSHTWEVSLSYRVPTFEDRLNKLNTILMAYSYILGGDNVVLGGGNNIAVKGN